MDLKSKIRVFEGFPNKDISFKDVSTLLVDPEALAFSIDQMADFAIPLRPDLIVGPESRGFLFGAPLAVRLNVGFLAARKQGKLPGKTLSESYQLEYGSETLEIPDLPLLKGKRVLLVDDLVATGGTFLALANLLRKAGAEVVGAVAVIELTEFHVSDKLDFPIHSLVQYTH